MIFKQWQQVLDGTKTQTRRPVRGENERLFAGHPHMPDTVLSSIQPGEERLKWQVGLTYAVQSGMSKKAVGRIKLTAIRREPLREISYVDALAEGMNIEAPLNNYGTGSIAVDAYAELWNSIYRGKKLADGTLLTWAQNPDVWVLTFELVEGITTA